MFRVMSYQEKSPISYTKPSSPIDIPTRRSFVSAPAVTPLPRSPSPDLLFEMSPVAAEFPSNADKPDMAPKANATRGYEPFLYPAFPSGTSRPQPPVIRAPNLDNSRRIMPSRPYPPTKAQRYVRNQPHIAQHDDLDPSRPCNDCRHPADTAMTKIAGFEPIIDHHQSPPGEPVRPYARLSPSSLWPSYSPPAPISYHKPSSQDDDDPLCFQPGGSVSAQRHLLQRIDNQDFLPSKSMPRSFY